MKSRKFIDYRSLCNYLKKHLPLDYPMSIRRVPTNSNTHADCDLRGKKFYIRINKDLSEDAAISILLHECAHCLSWFKKEEDHGKSFGISYSKIYSYYLDWVDT